MKLATISAALALAALAASPAPQPDNSMGQSSGSSVVTEEVRSELLAARETAWRAFFAGDPAQLEKLLAPELVAIQQSQERWESREELITMAHRIRKAGVRIARLEVPETKIQLYGDVAILYYSYVFETAADGWSVTDEGRGTEIFVRRNGRWVDVGWHLDHGPFTRRDGSWFRIGPSTGSPAQNRG